MLLAHVADLHLGKVFHERDLLPDQAFMLDKLLEALGRRRPAALLVAGDVYDRSIPSPEAMALFDSFLSRAVDAVPGLAVVVIPGNHDSAGRLSFGAGLLERAGVHLRTRADDCARPVLVERGGERLAVWPVPFLTPASFGAAGLRSQAELFAEALGRIEPALLPGSANVLLAHCFAAGGAESESERVFVGTAERIDPELFGRFDYSALGHLHRFQVAGAKARYPGSTLAYSFGESEAERGFLFVEVRPGGFEAELEPFRPLRAVSRVEGPFALLTAPGAFAEKRDDYVEARLTDPVPVINPVDPLRSNFPNLLSVRQLAFETLAPRRPEEGGGEEALFGARADIAEDFRAFHREMKGEYPDESAANLFAALVEEARHEAS